MEADFLKEWMRRSKALLERLKQISLRLDMAEDGGAAFAEAVLDYIQCRLMLKRRPRVTDRIYDLTEASVAAMAGLSSTQLAAMEEISGCTGAKSAMIKKVLLLMSLKSALGWQLCEEECLAMETVEDIISFGIRDAWCKRQALAGLS